MRRLIVLVLVATLFWSIYWAVAASGLRRSIDVGIESAAQSGWTAQVGAVDVKGFPNRLDTFATNVTVAPPDRAFEWVLPQFQVFALSYRPNEIIAVWPTEHQLSLASQITQIENEDMRASVKFGASTDVPLNTATFVAEKLRVDIATLGTGALENLRLALQKQEAETAQYRIGGEVLALSLPGLPVFDRIWLDGIAVLDKPLDRHIAATPAIPVSFDRLKAEMAWGAVSLKANGDLTVRKSGTLDGKVGLSVNDWPALLAQLQNAQIITFDQAQQVKQVLTFMAQGQTRIDVSLDISDGRVLIGPIPIAAIPPLRMN